MKEILRNKKIATLGVFLGLGGLGIAGCGNADTETASESSHAFDVCPTRNLRPVNSTPKAKARLEAENLACFILSEGSEPATHGQKTSLRNFTPGQRGKAYFSLIQPADSLLDGNAANKLKVTGSSLPDLRGVLWDVLPGNATVNDDLLVEGVVQGVGIEATLDDDVLFDYELSRNNNHWYLRSSFMDKGGISHDFNEKITQRNESKFRTLSNVATLAACYEQRVVALSYFHPSDVGHHQIMADCSYASGD